MKLSDPGVVALMTVAGTVAVGAIGGLVNWLIRRQSRSLDNATVRKTEADTVATEVKTARELLQEIRAYFTERLKEQAEDHAREIDLLNKRMASIEAQQVAMRSSFATHRTWDEQAWAKIRTSDPDWPPPPQVEGF